MSSPHNESLMLPVSSEILASATVFVPPALRLTVRGSPTLSTLPVTLTLRIPDFSSPIFIYFLLKLHLIINVLHGSYNKRIPTIGANQLCPSHRLFPYFMHSLETVSGLGISILYWHQANLTLFHLPQL